MLFHILQKPHKKLIILEYPVFTDFRSCINWDSGHIRLRISDVVLYDVAMSYSNIALLSFLYLGAFVKTLQTEHIDRTQITQL